MNTFKRPFYHNDPAIVEIETANKKLISFLFNNKRVEILNISTQKFLHNKNNFIVRYKKLDK